MDKEECMERGAKVGVHKKAETQERDRRQQRMKRCCPVERT